MVSGKIEAISRIEDEYKLINIILMCPLLDFIRIA